MKLKIIRDIKDNLNIATIKVEELSKDDIKRFSYFSEPEINLGGSIITDEYPDMYRKIYSDSPHIFTLEVSSPASDNEEKVDNWIDAISDRITDEMTALRAKTMTWAEEVVITI